MSTTEELKREMYENLKDFKKIITLGGFTPAEFVHHENSLEAYLEALRLDRDDLERRLAQMTEERDDIQLRLHAVDHAYNEQQKRHVIALTPAEILSKYTRVQWAEDLILQLPERHDGRNSWLMNYGEGREAKEFEAQWVRENGEFYGQHAQAEMIADVNVSLVKGLERSLETIRRQREFIRTLYAPYKARKQLPATMAQRSGENVSGDELKRSAGHSAATCLHRWTQLESGASLVCRECLVIADVQPRLQPVVD